MKTDIQKYRERQAKKDRMPRQFYLTDQEFKKVKDYIKEMRK